MRYCTCVGPALRFGLGLFGTDLGLLGKPLLNMVLTSGLRDLSASGAVIATVPEGLVGWGGGLGTLTWGDVDLLPPAYTFCACE